MDLRREAACLRQAGDENLKRWMGAAKPSASVIAPHPQEGPMDDVGRLVERLEVHPHHVVVTHAPGQPHQAAPGRLPAPVGHQRASERHRQHDL